MSSMRNIVGGVLVLGLSACASRAVPDENVGVDEAAEAWDSANNPASVDSTFVQDAFALPLEGSTDVTPVPADYWATYRDNINVRWDGEGSLSPAEKWEKAFNKPGFARRVSELYGIRSLTRRKECTTGDDCTDLKDGSYCAIAREETTGRCVPTWWGICPGWAASANIEPAPRYPVTKNGVTFYPGDSEALMALIYDKAYLPTKFLSRRCNLKDMPTDASGRITATECRDMNPGSFHVTVANMIGIRKKGFVVDRTTHYEVWNQPVRSFNVTNGVDGKLKEIKQQEAVSLLAQDLVPTEIFASTPLKAGEEKAGVYTATTGGRITMRTYGRGKVALHVKRGSSPDGFNSDCWATMASAAQECTLTVLPGDDLHYKVTASEDSQVALVAALPSAQNVSTTTFELFPSTPLARQASKTGSYVATATGQLIFRLSGTGDADFYAKKGGEASSASNDCRSETTGSAEQCMMDVIAGEEIFYNAYGYTDAEVALVGALVLTTLPTTAQLFPTTPIARRTAKTGQYTAVATGNILFTLSGTGDPDLFVKKGSEPTRRLHDCKSEGETAAETCRLAVNAGDVVHYFVYGYTDATAALEVEENVGPEYKFNARAKRFFHVKVDFKWIAEAGPARYSHVESVDMYTRTEHYEYILEADASGKILGGEWVGSSRTVHPDFLWWPTSPPQGAIVDGMLAYPEVRALNEEMSGLVHETRELLPTTAMERGATRDFEVALEPQSKLKVTTSGTGNVDVYVNLGATASPSAFVCSSNGPTANESCTTTAKAGGGNYFVHVVATAASQVNVSAVISKLGPPPPPPPPAPPPPAPPEEPDAGPPPPPAPPEEPDAGPPPPPAPPEEPDAGPPPPPAPPEEPDAGPPPPPAPPEEPDAGPPPPPAPPEEPDAGPPPPPAPPEDPDAGPVDGGAPDAPNP